MTGMLVQLMLPIGSVALLLVTLLFGANKAFSRTPIGLLHVMLTKTLPEAVGAGIICIIGRRNADACHTAADFLVNGRHPLVQIFFLILVAGGAGVFTMETWHRIPNASAGAIHHLLIPAAVGTCLGTFYLACTVSPGIVTPENVAQHVQRYDYDYLIFKPTVCRTCGIVKPARSKHCSICNVCISRCDHHCAWINNCVGYANHRWFIAFLLAVTTMCFYGAWLGSKILRMDWSLFRVHDLRTIDKLTGLRRSLTWSEAWLFIISRDVLLSSVTIFAAICGVIVLVFALYNLNMILHGFTANEKFKWEDLQADITDGYLTSIPRSLWNYNQSYQLPASSASTSTGASVSRASVTTSSSTDAANRKPKTAAGAKARKALDAATATAASASSSAKQLRKRRSDTTGAGLQSRSTPSPTSAPSDVIAADAIAIADADVDADAASPHPCIQRAQAQFDAFRMAASDVPLDHGIQPLRHIWAGSFWYNVRELVCP